MVAEESQVFLNPKTKGGLSEDAEKRERQLSGLRRGWKASRERKEATRKESPPLESLLLPEEKTLLAKRRKELRKKFTPEQYPLVEMYLLLEVLQRRAMRDCLSPAASSIDYSKLETANNQLFKAAAQLQLTPKEERKGGDGGQGLAEVLQRAAEMAAKTKAKETQ